MQRGKQKAEARGARSELSAAASDDPISEGWEDGEVELEIDVLNDKAKGVGLLEWWEHKQCQHSQFMGLGYGVTVPQYVARHALTGRPKPRLSGELRAARRARREAQLEEGETYYLGFEAFGMDEACDGTKMAAFLGDAAVDDSVVLPKDMYEDVYSVIDSGTTLSVTRLKSLLQRFDPT